MKNSYIALIFLGILILFIIGIFIYIKLSSSKNIYQKSCASDSECSSGNKCIYDPDYDKKICTKQTYCSIENNNLLECTPNNNDCQLCLNQPEFACVEVTKDKPYKWKKGDTVINVKDSKPGKGWCLPPLDFNKIKCNPNTTDILLEETKDNKGNPIYNWICICKYPDLITKNPGDQNDCNIVVACGENEQLGELYVPAGKACNNNDDCKKVGSDYCYQSACYKKWSNEDPKNGICKCKNGYIYTDDGKNKICTNDPCYPGKTIYDNGNNAIGCDCPNGMIGCPNQVISSQDFCPNINQRKCITDPCIFIDNNGNQKGKYDPKYGCNCEGNVKVFDPTSPVKAKCKNPQGSNICGNRGDYSIRDDGPNITETCINCKCPYSQENIKTDPNQLCIKSDGRGRNGEKCNPSGSSAGCCDNLHCDNGFLGSDTCY